MTSMKTTVAGIIAFLAVLFTQIATAMDSDPLTEPDWAMVVAGAAILWGLVMARDNNVTSERAGAKKF